MQRDLNWEFWLDVNLSPIIAKWLHDKTNFIFKSSYILKLDGLDDLEIYHRARQNPTPVVLISKDSDLPRLINKLGSPPKLINLRIGNTDNTVLFNFISNNLPATISTLLDDDVNIVDLIP
jgi:predicted nuclease of predicted toxin-antitoxin system